MTLDDARKNIGREATYDDGRGDAGSGIIADVDRQYVFVAAHGGALRAIHPDHLELRKQ